MNAGQRGADGLLVARAGLVLALRGLGITDRALLGAFESVPHEAFVPEEFAEHAYGDASLPIGHGQSVTSPHILARLLDALEAADVAKVLEIGTGSGYSAMLLSRLARRVFSVEIRRELLAEAVGRWRALGADHIVGFVADGLHGLPQMAPFDRILLTGSVLELPENLARQLADGGVLVAAVGEPGARQIVTTMRREGEEVLISERGTVRLPPLNSSLP